MSARQTRKTFPATPFDIAEAQLSRELDAYLKAINSYPDHFARTGLTFEQHLLNVIGDANGHPRRNHRIKAAS
jgi:hypothetical protein